MSSIDHSRIVRAWTWVSLTVNDILNRHWPAWVSGFPGYCISKAPDAVKRDFRFSNCCQLSGTSTRISVAGYSIYDIELPKLWQFKIELLKLWQFKIKLLKLWQFKIKLPKLWQLSMGSNCWNFGNSKSNCWNFGNSNLNCRNFGNSSSSYIAYW